MPALSIDATGCRLPPAGVAYRYSLDVSKAECRTSAVYRSSRRLGVQSVLVRGVPRDSAVSARLLFWSASHASPARRFLSVPELSEEIERRTSKLVAQ